MKPCFFLTYKILLIGLCLFCFNSIAKPLAVGDSIPPITAKDQHGMEYTFTNGTRYLLIAMEMGPATTANHKLAKEGPGFLEKRNAVYLMDIYPMPEIGRIFALPKMRKYPERIILLDAPDALNWAPVKSGYLTVLTLTPTAHIQKIAYWKPSIDPVSTCFQ